MESVGVKPCSVHEGMCPFLSKDRRCSIYSVRPSVCRLWGSDPSLPCEHGCTADRPPLSDDQVIRLIREIGKVGEPGLVGFGDLDSLPQECGAHIEVAQKMLDTFERVIRRVK